jgi:hypothetical protein
VSTQVPSLELAPKLPEMCGRATLAMEVSSTSMKAAIATVAAMIHGLTLGFHARSGAACSLTQRPLNPEGASLRKILPYHPTSAGPWSDCIQTVPVEFHQEGIGDYDSDC